MTICKWTKTAAASFLTFFCLCGIAWLWPQIWINPTTLTWIARFLERRHLLLNWKSVEVQIEPRGFFGKSIRFDFHRICIALPRSEFSGCADRVSARISVELSRWRADLSEITPLTVQNLRWQVGHGPGRVIGLVQIVGEDTRNWSARVIATAQFRDQSQIDLHGRAQLIQFSILRPRVDYQFRLNYHRKQKKSATSTSPVISAEVDGLLDRHRWKGGISFRIQHLIPGIPQVTGQGCAYLLERKTLRKFLNSRTSGSLKLNCPVSLTSLPVPNDDYQRIPHQFPGTLEVNMDSTDFIPRIGTRLAGNALLEIHPIHSPLIEGGGQMSARLVQGTIGESWKLWNAESKSALHFEISEFQRVVENFRNGPWAIPAPFQVLHGRISLDLQGRIDWTTGNFPFRIRTHLHSSTQILKLKGAGYLMIKKFLKSAEWRLGIDAVLTEVQLELPRLDLAKPPRLFLDQRFYSTWPPERPSHRHQFHYQISIRTQVGHPALLISNLTPRKIPIFFHISVSDELPLSGMVRLASFPVEVFRRKAQIETFQITFRDPLNSSLVFGSVQTSYADYKITVQLGASLDRPKIRFLSEPPLPETQIISVLLFGRPLDELTSIESSSVGNTQAAIADQALGLASLYALASTPIQSLAYDPKTGVISAKVKLAEGSSLSLGTNAKESAMVEFQQRLGSNWSLQAGVESSELPRTSASASLQWSKRY